MAFFSLTDISFNTNRGIRKGLSGPLEKLDSSKYESNTFRYPSDLGNYDKGHYMVIHINEQRETQFKNFLVKRYDNLDIDKLTGIINKAIESIELTGPKDGEHPNPFLKFKLTDNLVKTIIANVVSEYIKE